MCLAKPKPVDKVCLLRASCKCGKAATKKFQQLSPSSDKRYPTRQRSDIFYIIIHFGVALSDE